jgi:hypothetical protein
MAAERHADVWGEEAPEMESVSREASGEEELAAAILKLAYEDLQKHRGATDTRRKRAFREAYVWVKSNERRWPFSFLNVCDLLDLSPNALRTKLLSRNFSQN